MESNDIHARSLFSKTRKIDIKDPQELLEGVYIRYWLMRLLSGSVLAAGMAV
jgi:hypothetical protein